MILRMQFYQWYELGGDSGYLGLLVVQVRKSSPAEALGGGGSSPAYLMSAIDNDTHT
jgi:hypothetical protein